MMNDGPISLLSYPSICLYNPGRSPVPLTLPESLSCPPKPWYNWAAVLPQVLLHLVCSYCITPLLSFLLTLFVPFCPCRWEERPGFTTVENVIRSYYYSIATKTENGPETEDKSKAALPWVSFSASEHIPFLHGAWKGFLWNFALISQMPVLFLK